MSRLYRRGRLWPFDDHNPMNMIWHDDECVDVHIFEMLRDFRPLLVRHFPNRRQLHCIVHHIAEEMLAVVGANGDEIVCVRGIVTRTQARGGSAVFAFEQIVHMRW